MGRKSKLRNVTKRLSGVTMPVTRKRIKWSRNWPCMCGSDKKYKNCCLEKIDGLTLRDGNGVVSDIPDDIQGMIEAHNQALEEAKKEEGKNNA